MRARRRFRDLKLVHRSSHNSCSGCPEAFCLLASAGCFETPRSINAVRLIKENVWMLLG